VPGVYGYTSGADCLHGVYNAVFTCGDYTIVVTGANGAVPGAAGPPTPTPVIGPAGQVSAATVTVNDTAFAPATVNVALGGTVTWINKGNGVHTATSIPDVANAGLQTFDTGGLGNGQANTITFNTPGTFPYYSAPDCFSKSNGPGFNCAYYSVVVGNTPPPSTQTAAGPAPTATPLPGSNASVTIDDTHGFQPNSVTIKVGQSVAWINTGSNTHSVVINQNPQPNQPVPWWLPYQVPNVGGVFFDAGGLSPQQTFNFTFTVPGTFPYHSSTEPVYLTNYTNCSCTFLTYQFFGTVIVTP